MATSDGVYQDVQFLCNKYQHGYLSPSEFVRTFNTAQRIFLNRLLGQVQEYQNGRPVPRTGGHMTELVENKLAPITKKVSLTVTAGTAPVKTQYTDFVKQLSLNTTAGRRVRRIKHEQIHSATTPSVNPPTGTNPYYYETKDGFVILSGADTVTTLNLTYVKQPLDITWPYTLVSGVPTYNAGGSPVNPEWRDQEINEIIFIQLGLIGINLKDQELMRASQMTKQAGE